MTSVVWSSSDLPYACLKDMERVLAFQRAIRRAVRPGDVVVDAGAGTGILSFFAAAAGAATVYAVEIDPLMASSLRLSVALNGLEEQIVVIPGDVMVVDLPQDVDVVIGELMETGLIDELQVPVMNRLRSRGVISACTRVIPDRYLTSVELVAVDDTFYGYAIAAPFHEWPNYARSEQGWHATAVRPLTRRELVSDNDLCQPVAPSVERTVEFLAIGDGTANAVRLSGITQLVPGLRLGSTNALNGDKILRLPAPLPLCRGERVACRVSFDMGGGLGTFACRREG